MEFGIGLLAVVAAVFVARWVRRARLTRDRLAAEALASAARKAGGIIERAALLENAPCGEYFASSVLARFEAAHGNALEERLTPAERALLDAETGRAVDDAVLKLNGREAYRRGYNEAFVPRRMAEMQAWFDGRATKLTEEQRRAVVTDEDTTLVIAAAGSGKTATIVAKAEYLVKRGLARPEEVCLLAFNKRAAEEIGERLSAVGLKEVTSSTFHRLGYRVLQDATGYRPPVSPLATDEQALKRFLDGVFRQLLLDDRYRMAVIRWLCEFRVTEEMLETAPNAHVRLQRERALDPRSMNGTLMRSQAEVRLANWLTCHGVAWQYERVYPFPCNEPGRRAYQPDFFLPQAVVGREPAPGAGGAVGEEEVRRARGAWMELWALDQAGNCAPHIDAQAYRESIAWKRQTHATFGTTLLEVWQEHTRAGAMDAYLPLQLRRVQIACRLLSAEELQAILDGEQSSVASQLGRLLKSFLGLFRAGSWDRERVRKRASSERDTAFLELFFPVLDAFERELQESQTIDFDEMLNGATKALPRARVGRFRYVLVDEFQDTSRSRLELVQALREVSPGARLVFVGDDWQSINGFAGSDLSIFTGVERECGATARVVLGTTFRLLPDVTGVSSRFVSQNPAQVSKEVRTVRPESDEGGVVLVGHRGDAWVESLDEVLGHALRRVDQGNRVHILSRTNAPLGDEAFTELVDRYREEGLEIEVSTVHRAKGLEADHVVVLGLTSRSSGFPNLMETDPVLSMVAPRTDLFEHAEERRLFYVAMTRSRARVYLCFSEEQPSVFVEELLARERDEIEVLGKISERLHCPKCHGKTILRKAVGNDVMWACTHYPLCDGKLDACKSCGDGALELTDPHTFECSACHERSERCPLCEQGHLQVKANRNNGRTFLGCSKWRPQGAGCNYVRNV